MLQGCERQRGLDRRRPLDAARRARPTPRSRATSPSAARPGGRRRPTTRTSARRWSKAASTAKLPAGYSIENYYPPKDNYGRDQLFEALGLAVAKDGTVVVATRSAGSGASWTANGACSPKGLFDSLGVVVEDGKGLVVVAGQKAELTRISDTNGDGIADKYETLFDAHSYHAQLPQLHARPGARRGRRLLLRAEPRARRRRHRVHGRRQRHGHVGRVQRLGRPRRSRTASSSCSRTACAARRAWASSPDGRVWYTDNQGDFVGTSKLFELKKDKFYGHPAGLVDLPGMTPDSPEIKYDKVADRREHAVVLFPHNRVANSPGNPAWVTQKKFGPFAGQMLIGDQTQSNLLRVVAAEGGRRGAGQRHAVLRRARVGRHASGVPAATAACC